MAYHTLKENPQFLDEINLQKIVRFLIPAEMLIGKFPTKEFLQRFNLEDTYWGIAEACMRGDIASLE
jgi:hypothetical protein